MSLVGALRTASRGLVARKMAMPAQPSWAAQTARTFAAGHKVEPTSTTPLVPKHNFKPGDAPPSVEEAVVTFTLVNADGERTVLSGVLGETVAEVAARYNYDELADNTEAHPVPSTRVVTDLWTEDIFGDGVMSYQTHVMIPPKYQAQLPEMTSQEDQLLSLMDHLGRGPRTPESRIASNLILEKGMDGIVIYVPDPYPCNVP